jgi:hypothetical protein
MKKHRENMMAGRAFKLSDLALSRSDGVAGSYSSTEFSG